MIKMIITLKRRDGMSHDAFVRYQRDVHRPLLMSIPEAQQYIRRFVVSYPIHAPDYSGPNYDSVVEAWFDSMEDMDALYFSENFAQKVAPDHANFMDMSSYGRIVAEEDVVVGSCCGGLAELSRVRNHADRRGELVDTIGPGDRVFPGK